WEVGDAAHGRLSHYTACDAERALASAPGRAGGPRAVDARSARPRTRTALRAPDGRPGADRHAPAPDGLAGRRHPDADLLSRQRLFLGLRRGVPRPLDHGR